MPSSSSTTISFGLVIRPLLCCLAREAPRKLGQERPEKLGLLTNHLCRTSAGGERRGHANQRAIGSAVHDAIPHESRSIEVITANCTAGKLIPVKDHDPLVSAPDHDEGRGEGGGTRQGDGHGFRAQVGPAAARVHEGAGGGPASFSLGRGGAGRRPRRAW